MNKVVPKKKLPPAIGALQNFHDLEIFVACYKRYVDEGDDNKLLILIETFFNTYPFFRRFLIDIYVKQMNIHGNLPLANEVARIYVEVTERLSLVGQKQLKLPLIFENHSLLVRIGELVDQSASTLLQHKMGRIKDKPVLYLSKAKPLANDAFIPYLRDCFELIEDPGEANFLHTLREFSPYSAFFYKYSSTQYGHSGNFFHDCFQDITEHGLSPSPFSLKDVTVEKARKFLEGHGLAADDEFVVLHLREKGYFDAVQHRNRNVDVKKYIPAVNYLLDQGLKVVRIGNERMTAMYERSGFIDLTSKSRPPEVDIFLCGAAKFYFGSPSGPYSLSSTFGIPCCLTSAVPYGGVRANDFVQYLRFAIVKRQNEVATFSEIEKLGLKNAFSQMLFAKEGLKPIFPTESENLKLVEEMLEYLDRGKVFRLNQSKEKQKRKSNMWGALCSDSLRLLDTTKPFVGK